MKKGRTGQSLIGTVAIYVVCIFLAVICILDHGCECDPIHAGNSGTRNFFDSINAFI